MEGTFEHGNLIDTEYIKFIRTEHDYHPYKFSKAFKIFKVIKKIVGEDKEEKYLVRDLSSDSSAYQVINCSKTS